MNNFSIKADDLAYWYLRLNGFLTTHNFIVHDERYADQRTDVDILGVRFPFRNEINMPDSDCFSKFKTKPLFIFVEATKGRCKLNGPWTCPEKENMQRVLNSIGAFKEETIENIAESLYSLGYYENDLFRVNLVCIGKEIDKHLSQKYPKVPQILFNNVLDFMHKRFKKFHDQKQSHQQWDETGKNLWDLYASNRKNSDNFIKNIEIT